VVAQNVAFWILAIAMAGAAIGVVRSQNVVHAALYLVVVLAGAAAQYILLAAEFVAWVQVLIYVGAVVVLLLFALMLTRAPTGHTDDLTVHRALPAAIVAGLVALLLAVTVVAGFSDVRIDLDGAVVGSAETTGRTVFSMWVLPFEVLSVLLLAALVGAIALSKQEAR
jgi:NADH-quinone oxidoreductase subunit J